jgi:hypothetical protein
MGRRQNIQDRQIFIHFPGKPDHCGLDLADWMKTEYSDHW